MITPKDKIQLVRIASSLPAGDKVRRAILTGLTGRSFIAQEGGEEGGKGGGPPPGWEDFMKQNYDGGKKKVPNPNSETKDKFPEVAASTASKDPAFMKKLMGEYKKWMEQGGSEKGGEKKEDKKEDKTEERKKALGKPGDVKDLSDEDLDTLGKIIDDASNSRKDLIGGFASEFKESKSYSSNTPVDGMSERDFRDLNDTLTKMNAALKAIGKDFQFPEVKADGSSTVSVGDKKVQLKTVGDLGKIDEILSQMKIDNDPEYDINAFDNAVYDEKNSRKKK